jgi:hypothetical protein
MCASIKTLSLKRAKTAKKVGIACKRKTAGWNDDFLVEVLLAQSD